MRNSKFYSQMLDEVSQGYHGLEDKPEESLGATLDALWVLASGEHLAAELSAQAVLPELTSDQKMELSDLVKKRLSGIPLAHLTGRQRFMEVEFEVSSDALIPRKETELVGYAALEVIKAAAEGGKSVLVVDVCTGAGNLAIAFAFHEPKAKVFGADLSPEAVGLAAKNAATMKLGHRVEFSSGELLEPFQSDDFWGKVDVLTCNPPYISTGKLESMPKEIINHEPDMAFNGGPFGISILSRLIKQAPEFIKSGGWLAFEVGAGQGPGIQRMLQKNPKYGEIKVVNNGEGQIRALLAGII